MSRVAKHLAFAVVLGAGLASPVQCQVGDTTTGPRRGPLFQRADLLSASAVLVATAGLMPIDHHIAAGFDHASLQRSGIARSTARVFNIAGDPGAVIASLGMIGAGYIVGSGRLKDMGVHTTMAVAMSGLVTALIKGVAGRQRPSLDRRDADEFSMGAGFQTGARTSFPSGHTSAAFAFASTVAFEAEHWSPQVAKVLRPALFASAGLVGLARMFYAKHWASDVVLGAGIGTFSGLVVVRYGHGEAGPFSRPLMPRIGPSYDGVALSWSLPLD